MAPTLGPLPPLDVFCGSSIMVVGTVPPRVVDGTIEMVAVGVPTYVDSGLSDH